MANLELGRGKPGNQYTRDTPPPLDPDVLAAKIEEISAGTLVRDDNGDVSPVLRRVVRRAAEIELRLEWYDSRPRLTTREEERRRQLEGDLSRFLADLGMSAKTAMSYREIEQEQRAKQQRTARPPRDPVHLRRTLGILMGSGALGTHAQEYAARYGHDGHAEFVFLTPSERAAITGESDPTEPGKQHEPEVAKLVVLRDGIKDDEEPQ